ncbi:MAG: hemerythrin domain-containing protein [Gammaproteobacteria bacterium]|nr:hemerythrin domain-containing protein [Gammaproteobacteria bacterium]MCW8986049.1 hemerythrin domain-containing protein [Gammaproteobacteria bacterium]MCW9031515.1 hemerythrin domain-containing protein [Gammaproteobacteria bacterium]
MYSTLDELKEQNLEISQLCEVLYVLVEQSSLHDNPFVRELMTRFKEKVWVHLVFEDNTFYSALLNSDDEKIRETVRAFHDSAKEIKHRFSSFVRRCCTAPETAPEYEALSKESHEIFTLIRDRIAYENEKMFPLIEKLQ